MMVRETFGAKRIHGMRHRDTDAFKQSEEEKKHLDRNRNGKRDGTTWGCATRQRRLERNSIKTHQGDLWIVAILESE